MKKKTKALLFLVLFAVLFTVSSTQIKEVSAVTLVPVIEEISFTDGGANEIDFLLLARPLNIHVNDLLVLIICSDSNEVGTFFNAIENFTKLGESGDQLCDSHIAVYYKVADGTEIEVNATSVSSANMLGWYIRIHGVDTADIIEAQNFDVSVAVGDNPHEIPSITTTKNNCLVLYGISFDGGDCYPTSVLTPFIELSDRVNTGARLPEYVSGAFGYQNLFCLGSSEDCLVYAEETDGASYFQFAVNGNIESTETTTTANNVFQELFLSDNMWGYVGVIGLVIIGWFITNKEKTLGVFMIIVYSLLIAQYLTLISANPDYWWQVIILILGVLQCTIQLIDR